MKQVRFLLAGLFLSLFATFSFANPNEDSENLIMRVQPTEEKAIHITLANLQQATTKVTLKNLSGEVYYSDTIRNHNGYRKGLDLYKLPKGRYVLTVSQKDTEWTSVVVIGTEQIQVSRTVTD